MRVTQQIVRTSFKNDPLCGRKIYSIKLPNFSTSCQREELKVDLESLNKVMIRWGDEMLTENIATQIKIPKKTLIKYLKTWLDRKDKKVMVDRI